MTLRCKSCGHPDTGKWCEPCVITDAEEYRRDRLWCLMCGDFNTTFTIESG